MRKWTLRFWNILKTSSGRSLWYMSIFGAFAFIKKQFSCVENFQNIGSDYQIQKSNSSKVSSWNYQRLAESPLEESSWQKSRCKRVAGRKVAVRESLAKRSLEESPWQSPLSGQVARCRWARKPLEAAESFEAFRGLSSSWSPRLVDAVAWPTHLISPCICMRISRFAMTFHVRSVT